MTPNTAPRIVYIVSEDLIKVCSRLPSNLKRSYLVHSLVTSLNLLRPSDADTRHARIVRPPPANKQDITAYHDAEFVDFLLDPANSALDVARTEDHARFGLEDDCPPFLGLPAYVRLVAGGALAAARAVRSDDADVAIFWDGGRHHATKSRAAGFCYIADAVLVLLHLSRRPPLPPPSLTPGADEPLQERPRAPRVLYLDLDLHFSDGVSKAFYVPGRTSSSNLLTFSVHHAAPGFYPSDALSSLPDPSSTSSASASSSTFDPYTLSLPLARGAGDATFARVWTRCVEPVVHAFRPDVLVLQCGVDGLAGDPCAIWNWSVGGANGDGNGDVDVDVIDQEGGGGVGSLGWCVRRALGWAGKTVLLGGGGYNAPNAARAWAHLTSLVLGRPLDREAPIPEHATFPLYAPSFVLDVPAGHMRDENTDKDLRKAGAVFSTVAQILRGREDGANAL